VTVVYRWFKYVRHHDREQAESEGWVFSADLAHHSAYSILMELPMPSASQIPSTFPSPAERFEEAVAALDRAQRSGIGVDIAFARRELAIVAWNLKHAIVEGLRLSDGAQAPHVPSE
jgi:hypothetical protein